MSEPRRFTSADRALVESDVIEVLTLGLDIGSATSHVSISRLTMVRGHNRYTVSSTEVVYQSPVMKTPFGGDGRAFIIRTELESMIDESLLNADVDRDDIESGVVILTGNALRRQCQTDRRPARIILWEVYLDQCRRPARVDHGGLRIRGYPRVGGG